MSNYSNKQLEQLIGETGRRFTISTAHKSAMKLHLLDAIKSNQTHLKQRTINSHIFNQRRFFAMPLIPIIIAVIIAIGGGTAVMANNSNPGSPLYSVDQWMERIQEKLATTSSARAELMARFSEERLEELEALGQIDPSELETKAKELWEQHREDAIERLTASIERVQELQTQFETKLAETDSETQKAVFEKIIEHLEEVEAKRAERLEQVDDKIFPGLVGLGTLPRALNQYRQEHREEIKQIREEIREEMKELLEQEDESENEDENENEDEDEDEDDNDDDDDDDDDDEDDDDDDDDEDDDEDED